MNVYVWWPVEYSDMQWPCPVGFHVPSTKEWQWLKTIIRWLSLTTWDDWRINLHMPFAGYRDFSTADLSDQGSDGYYWSSSPYGSDYPDSAHRLDLDSSSVYADYISPRAYGFSVRCFKNSFEVPTSSWTVINWTLWSAWTFRNQAEWLISITNTDWTTWYTIQDKNLWATTVYNDGDTLSEVNCGKYYQWGNNYWFARTWSVTTSSTKVDASSYWPWNYYSSNTFITWYDDWSNVHNDNLRWWVSQWSWTKSVEVKNIYIGEYVPDFATRWPAPKWFHVPSKDDWVGLVDIMTALWYSWSSSYQSYSTYLHLPGNWFRNYTDASIYSIDSAWIYWSSTAYTSNEYWYCFHMTTSSPNPQYNFFKTYWLPIRPFKDEFVTPESWWTVIVWTIGSSWIFWNRTDWIISITSDGSTGYTIADKNLWATTVYNWWNTHTQANSWNYYQWWNNHWFPYTWNVTTSSTQVNAGSYWPWNYYDSSTFIIRTSSPYWWDSSNNANLRWWEDWNVPVT